jgi:hypothetical protein
MLLGCFAIILIVAPVIICNSLRDTLPRLIVIIVATSFFIASLSGGTQAKTVEIFVAGAAYVHSPFSLSIVIARFHGGSADMKFDRYATVLTVFITQGPSGA